MQKKVRNSVETLPKLREKQFAESIFGGEP